MRIFLIGYPGEVGGAGTECWHTLRLWRRFGLDVTLLPTWQADPRWRARLDRLGCPTVETCPDGLASVPGLAGAIVVAFCNGRFLDEAERFQALGCRTVWVGCMNWLFPQELTHYARARPFDAYVFQSAYQQGRLSGPLARHGVRSAQQHRIRGAFVYDDVPFDFHARNGGPLVIGRISRADPDKFSSSTWSIYGRVAGPVRARVMAFDRGVLRKLGPPPDWVECLPAGAEPFQTFFGRLHLMMQVNGGAEENWPRSALEAMACGVPIVAENRWGWREMIQHGRTGFLANSDDELAHYAAQLLDDDRRLELAYRARQRLEDELAEPETIWSAWRRLLESV